MQISFSLSSVLYKTNRMRLHIFSLPIYLTVFFWVNAFASDFGTWQWLGGPSGGLGYDIRMHPDNSDIMFVTDALTGVYKSTDGGKTWTASNNGITTRSGASRDSIPAFCLTIDPNDPDIVWTGMSDFLGVYRSSDQGETWVEKTNGIVESTGISFRGFTVEPGNSSVVYAAAEISSYEWSGDVRTGKEFDLTKGVVYKTIDGGENWKAVWRGENLARYIWIHPENTDIVYVSTGIFDREAANSDAATDTPGGEGIIKSTDGGVTWTRVNNGLKNLYVGSLFMHPENPDILLAGTGCNAYNEKEGVYLTTDGGSTWTCVLEEAGTITSVEFCLSDPQIAYAGSMVAVYRSTDGGRTWRQVAGQGGDGWGPPNMQAGFPIDFQVDPADPDRIFANNYGGGNFLSTDGGQTWVNSSKGYTGASVKKLAVAAADPALVVAGVLSGFYISKNGGEDWDGLYPAGGWHAVGIDPADADVIMGAIAPATFIFVTSDGGRTWDLNDDAGLSAENTWRSIRFAPSNPSIIYAGSCTVNIPEANQEDPGARGIYVSSDSGLSWSAANDNISKTANVWDLDVAGGDALMVMAATTNLGVIKTIDGGTNWSQMNAGLPPDIKMLSIAMHPTDPRIALVGAQGNGIYRTTDGGQNWTASQTGLVAEADIADIVFNPKTPDQVWAADQTSGIYRSDDGGLTWIQKNSGLMNRSMQTLAISGDGNHVYAGSDGSGAYRMDLNGMAPESSPDSGTMDDSAPPSDSGDTGSPSETADGGGSGGGGCYIQSLMTR